MRIHKPQRQTGIALIIVLLMVMVFGILAGGFAFTMKVETKLARNASHDVELEWLGRSGMELAKYVLAQESTGPFGMCDSLMQRWAGGPGDTNSGLAEIPLENCRLGSGSFSVKITDLDRKFNINVADEMILQQALILIGVDGAELPTIVDSILDWRDMDDGTRPNGTESDTYRNYPYPYVAKNGPLDDLSELLLVRGVTRAMYYGSSGGGAPMAVMNRPLYLPRDGFQEPAYVVGLVDLFTTVSSRLININTASATQLQIIPGIDENVAAAIIMTRSGPDGMDGSLDDMPFRNPAELARVPGIHPMIGQQMGRFFTVRSLIFEVRVTAQVDTDRRTYVGLLRRNSPRDIQLLSFRWE